MYQLQHNEVHNSVDCSGGVFSTPQQGGEGRQTKAENLRSSRAFQFLFYLMSRYGIFKNIFIFVGIGRSNEHGKR